MNYSNKITQFNTKETKVNCYNCQHEMTVRYSVLNQEEEADNLDKYIREKYADVREIESVINTKKQELKRLEDSISSFKIMEEEAKKVAPHPKYHMNPKYGGNKKSHMELELEKHKLKMEKAKLDLQSFMLKDTSLFIADIGKPTEEIIEEHLIEEPLYHEDDLVKNPIDYE